MQAYSKVMQKLLEVKVFSFRVELKRENDRLRMFPDTASPYYYQVVARSVESGIDVVMQVFATPEEAFDYHDNMQEQCTEAMSRDIDRELGGVHSAG